MSEHDYVRYDIKELIGEIHRDMAGLREDVRDRFHKLAGSIEGLNKRLTAVERMVDQHEKVRQVREPQIEDLLATARVAREVKSALDAQSAALEASSTRGFSRKQKWLAAGLGFASFALLVVQTFH